MGERKLFLTAPEKMQQQPQIELDNVDVALQGRVVLRDITWALRAGEHWAVIGANGSGKSTFLRLLRGEVWPAPGKGVRQYRFNGKTQTSAVGVKEVVALVSPESQQRYLQQEWQLTGGDVINSGFGQGDYVYTRLTSEQRQAGRQIADRLHVTALLGRDVQTLSTGELRKVLIARALVGRPRILLLDEVCDGLDAAFRREMLAMIDEIARHGTQVIYTTHRADEALPAITHELTLEQGRVVRSGAARQARARVEMGRGSKPKTGQTEVDRRDGEPLITILDANVFLNRRKVLRDISWQLRGGENWVVLGGNGAGKTTFLKLVASDLYAATGATVERFGFDAEDTIWDLRQRIGCVSPLLQTEYREVLTGAQVVASGFFSSIGLVQDVSARQWRRVRELMRCFRLDHLAAKPLSEMSFGEVRKILTLRALVHGPDLLILDEPFDGLDASARSEFAEALEAIAAGGTQLLIVTHHLDDLPRAINRGLFLEQGRVLAEGPWPAFREHPQVVALFGGVT